MNDNIIPMTEGDQRCGTLAEAILSIIRERTGGMPFPSVLGVLRIVEHQLFEEQQE